MNPKVNSITINKQTKTYLTGFLNSGNSKSKEVAKATKKVITTITTTCKSLYFFMFYFKIG